MPFRLEASQGDRLVGKISRAEVASVAVAALDTPASVGEGRAWTQALGSATYEPASNQMLPWEGGVCACLSQ